MENTQENIEKIGKEGTIIKYNKNIMENEDTDIVFHIFKDENTARNVAIFVLKYNLKEGEQQIPYQVVLGKIQLKKMMDN